MSSVPKSRRDSRRARNGAYSITKALGRGGYRAAVTLGKDPLTGKPDRKFIRAATEEEVRAKADAVVAQAERMGWALGGDIGPRSTLGEWAGVWLRSIELSRKRSTFTFYELAFRTRILPVLGRVRLSAITPERVEHLLYTLSDTVEAGGQATTRPVSPAVRKATHRALRACLGVAARRGYIARNPAALVKVPEAQADEIIPLDRDELLQVLAACKNTPMFARWLCALVLGMRQAEVLGLRFADLDLGAAQPVLHVEQTAVRQVWAHGCGTPATCGKTPAKCPSRHRLEAFTTPKSRAGKRTIALPATVAAALAKRRSFVASMKLAAGPEWEDHDLVFPGPNGRPIGWRSDARAWHKLLESAGVRQIRLHDARHSSASVNVILGTPQRVMAESYGWGADAGAMMANYQHVLDDARAEAVAKIERYLFGGGN